MHAAGRVAIATEAVSLAFANASTGAVADGVLNITAAQARTWRCVLRCVHILLRTF